MDKENIGIFGEERTTLTVRELLLKYISKWPLFIVLMLFCMAAAALFARYTIPEYMAYTNFLVKGDEGENNFSSEKDLIQAALQGKREVNLNNDMMLVRSAALMQRTVAKHGFNIAYLQKGTILNIDIYNSAPFTLVPRQINDSTRTYNIYIKKMDKAGGSFMNWPKGADQKLYPFLWNQPFTLSGQSFVLVPKKAMQAEDGEYIVRWQPVADVAAKLVQELSAKTFDIKTNVIQLSVKTESFEKGKDVLNALFTEFNLSDVEDRNRLSENTVQFIDERLVAISGELQGVEGHLENYQSSNQLVDIKGQAQLSLSNSDVASKTLKDIGVQQRVATMLSEYLTNPVNSHKLVPSSLNLTDATLTSLITQYNELQLKKEREAQSVAPESTVMQDLDAQVANLKSSALEDLNNIKQNLQLQENKLLQQSTQYQGFLSSVPHSERVMQEIKRKQTITEGLYLYLLQKREETAISGRGANVPHYKQIDLAWGFGPIWPNSGNIILYSAMLGFALAFAWIYISYLLNDKITSKEDIKRTNLPLIGEISKLLARKKQAIAVLERNIVGEQFRGIRTNLYFILKDRSKKVILITSSSSNDGKSFVSLNLAAVYALPGKKIALLEFDTRKPVISTNLQFGSTKGLTNYLAGEVNDLSLIRNNVTEVPGLHIYHSGPVPLNPADLLLAPNMNRLFDALRAEYDYIIIDSPPAGLVSDPFILGEYCDLVLYIVRNQKTLKKQLDFISQVAMNKTLNNVYLVLNGIDRTDQYKYGYKNYYGYGHSNGSEQKKKKFSFDLKKG